MSLGSWPVQHADIMGVAEVQGPDRGSTPAQTYGLLRRGRAGKHCEHFLSLLPPSLPFFPFVPLVQGMSVILHEGPFNPCHPLFKRSPPVAVGPNIKLISSLPHFDDRWRIRKTCGSPSRNGRSRGPRRWRSWDLDSGERFTQVFIPRLRLQ